jgi:hypothetical protein
MRIDDQVEQRVRDTLHWVVKQKSDEFDAALKTFPDAATRISALELLGAVAGFVLVDTYGRKPSPDEVGTLAAEIADVESWASLTGEEVKTYLNGVLAGTPLVDTLPPKSIVLLAFVVAANLLSSKPKDKGEWWFNYLDRIELAIEAAS